MRGNIIEELYYGNIDPQDRGYHPQSPVKKVSDSLNDLEEKLTEQLAGENKALFLRFCNVYAEFMGESELDTFITGFRLGARFMMDTFLSDDAPFESFHLHMDCADTFRQARDKSDTADYNIFLYFLYTPV